MANRRMFARSVTSSGRFLRLSAQARALYYDLGMEADDDGFVEALVRLRATGAEEVHLIELEQRGFITIEDRDDFVVHLVDWTVNNLVRRDRYTPSIYRSRFPHCVPELPAEEPQPEPSCQPVVNQAETNGEPEVVFLGDSRLTQVRFGKDSLIKDNRIQDNSGNNRQGQENARARARSGGSLDAQNPGDSEIEFVKNRGNSVDLLRNSKYFSGIHGSVPNTASG